MSTDTIVFLGPTLSRQEAKECLPEACFSDPVRCGDVFKLMSLSPKRLIIIDGLFEQTASVWHKEILFALDSGVEVWGAASMGALRAAELCDEGMRGVGEIFQWYHSGFIDGDDEVSLPHSSQEAGFQSRVVPLVNVRATLKNAIKKQAIEMIDAQKVIDALKQQPYYQRDVYQTLTSLGLSVEIFKKYTVDQKACDARAALSLAHQTPIRSKIKKPQALPSYFTKRIYREAISRPFDNNYDWLPETERALCGCSDAQKQRLIDLAKVLQIEHEIRSQGFSTLSTEYAETQFEKFYALYRDVEKGVEARLIAKAFALIYSYYRDIKVSLSPGMAQAFFNRFRKRHGLKQREATLQWLKNNDLDETQALPLFVEYLSLFEYAVLTNGFDLLDIPIIMDSRRWVLQAYQYLIGEQHE
ncbi:MAG: hypothetical protein COV52_05410 [Gammaproteobacteria bacterium CG11_big_fil_rev_8_21_14_0_20_46_22]|nr:MAG: hypothetical protein COW05_08250 [Gammaproteobacteria bacterium CG12_big_fil_rev_8_21_14_0_65_46_12]PIR10942.1 MAG: hypothetical protein COV52_05410 [Gammaproteobacteria bacterium CG11_big_fil_rev_8_21_14_0_20_46_22]